MLDLSKFSHEFIGARAIHRYASFLVAFDSRNSLTSVVKLTPLFDRNCFHGHQG